MSIQVGEAHSCVATVIGVIGGVWPRPAPMQSADHIWLLAYSIAAIATSLALEIAKNPTYCTLLGGDAALMYLVPNNCSSKPIK